jgi:formylglycine-generating enzyme required for sulfatase activity
MRWFPPFLASLVLIGLTGCGNAPAPAIVTPSPITPTELVKTSTKPEPTKPETTPIAEPKFEPLPGKEYLVNSIGMRFVNIPAGKFIMGSPKDEKERQENETPHEVTISKPFDLGVFTVTQEEYEQVMKTNPSIHKEARGQKTRGLPVEMVSWDDAQEFCKKLSALPDEKNAGRVYRLPTEAEWEYACRAGTTTPFSFGKECNGKQANCRGDFPYGTDEKGQNLHRTCPVGSYAPNAFGLYDMHGNVWQWCEDWYGNYPNGAVSDPKGPDKGAGRVLRGGSWIFDPGNCRAAHRGVYAPGRRGINFGFRVAVRLD